MKREDNVQGDSSLTICKICYLLFLPSVFPAFSSREVTLGQMPQIGFHFIIYQVPTHNAKGSSGNTVENVKDGDLELFL